MGQISRNKRVHQDGAGWQNQADFTGWGIVAETNGSIRMGQVGRIMKVFQDRAAWLEGTGFPGWGRLAESGRFIIMWQISNIRQVNHNVADWRNEAKKQDAAVGCRKCPFINTEISLHNKRRKLPR